MSSEMCAEHAFQKDLYKQLQEKFNRPFTTSAVFSSQKTGQRDRTIQLFEKFVTYLSGGDSAQLIAGFLLSRRGKQAQTYVREKLQTVPPAAKLLESVKTVYESEPSADAKKRLLKGVSTANYSRSTLTHLGWTVPKWKWTAARRWEDHPKRDPPNCKRLTEATKLTVQSFYHAKSAPGGNQTCYDKVSKLHLPVGLVSVSIKRLHEEYNLLHPLHQVAYSTFCKLKPKTIRKAKRALDMCEICVKGKQVCNEWVKRRESNGGTDNFAPEEASQVLENIRLYDIHKTAAATQRSVFNHQISTAQPGEAIIVVDYKENLRLGVGPVEVGRDYYERVQVTCLGFTLYIGMANGTVLKHHVDALSYNLSHDEECSRGQSDLL